MHYLVLHPVSIIFVVVSRPSWARPVKAAGPFQVVYQVRGSRLPYWRCLRLATCLVVTTTVVFPYLIYLAMPSHAFSFELPEPLGSILPSLTGSLVVARVGKRDKARPCGYVPVTAGTVGWVVLTLVRAVYTRAVYRPPKLPRINRALFRALQGHVLEGRSSPRARITFLPLAQALHHLRLAVIIRDVFGFFWAASLSR